MSPTDLTPLIAAINPIVANLYSEPFTAEIITSTPRGQTGIDGNFCDYSLFTRNEQPIFAIYFGSRFANETYMEFDLTGERLFERSSWGGMSPSTGYPDDYIQHWQETCQRAAEAGIPSILK